MKRSAEKIIKIEEQKKNIGHKETELKNLKKKSAIRQDFIRAENERKQKEYEIEKDKLFSTEKKLQSKLDENAKNLVVSFKF